MLKEWGSITINYSIGELGLPSPPSITFWLLPVKSIYYGETLILQDKRRIVLGYIRIQMFNNGLLDMLIFSTVLFSGEASFQN